MEVIGQHHSPAASFQEITSVFIEVKAGWAHSHSESVWK